MKAYVFPGQGAQFEGMGKDLYESDQRVKELFDRANELLGFRITDVMFEGGAEELKQTKITQPAIFLHSIAKTTMVGEAFQPQAVAGHSLGEFTALVAAGAISFEDGLKLVQQRAQAMQRACEAVPGTMAAIIGLEDEIVEDICRSIDEIVVPANYNSPGQLVVSGTLQGVEQVVAKAKAAGARKAVMLPVGGAFHSPLMVPAKEELEHFIQSITFQAPSCPIYQNVTARPETNPERIQTNLIDQLTGAVRWTQTVQQMLNDGVSEFVEVGGTGKVLRGLIMRVNRRVPTSSL